MICPACQYVMDDFDESCPRCDGKGFADPLAGLSSSAPIVSDVAKAATDASKKDDAPLADKIDQLRNKTGDFLKRQAGKPKKAIAPQDNLQATLPLPTSVDTAQPTAGSPVKPSLPLSRVVGILGLLILFVVIPLNCFLKPSNNVSGGITVGPAGSGPTVVTLEEYNRCQTGMTLEEVEKIVGEAGSESSRTGSGDSGSVTVGMQWVNPGGSNMMTQFQDNKLITKTQEGLS